MLHFKRFNGKTADGTKVLIRQQPWWLQRSFFCSSGRRPECSSRLSSSTTKTHRQERARTSTSLRVSMEPDVDGGSLWRVSRVLSSSRGTPAPRAKRARSTTTTAATNRHHSSTRFLTMISRTSVVTSCRMLSKGSSVRQKRTTLPSGFTRNFQKFHLGTLWTESEKKEHVCH